MNKEQVEELIFDLKEQINFVKQYRILTNELCNNHISNYDIENFKEKEGIYSTDNKLFDDYEYDLYNFISIKDWEKALQELERYKNIIDELETYLQRKYCEYIDMESDDAFVIGLVLDTLRELKGE